MNWIKRLFKRDENVIAIPKKKKPKLPEKKPRIVVHTEEQEYELEREMVAKRGWPTE